MWRIVVVVVVVVMMTMMMTMDMAMRKDALRDVALWFCYFCFGICFSFY